MYTENIKANRYLDFRSDYHKHFMKNILFRQMRKIQENCTSTNRFKSQLTVLCKRFLEEDYPQILIKFVSNKIMNFTEKSCLIPKNEPVRTNYFNASFLTRYNIEHSYIKKIIAKHWDILQSDPFYETVLWRNLR